MSISVTKNPQLAVYSMNRVTVKCNSKHLHIDFFLLQENGQSRSVYN